MMTVKDLKRILEPEPDDARVEIETLETREDVDCVESWKSRTGEVRVVIKGEGA